MHNYNSITTPPNNDCYTFAIITALITLLLHHQISTSSPSPFASAQDLIVNESSSFTVFSDESRTTSTTLRGNVCEYCSVQIGPNFTAGGFSAEFHISLTVSKGAHIKFVDFKLEGRKGVLVSITMNSSSVCGTSYSWRSDRSLEERDKVKLSFIDSSISVNSTDDSSATGIDLQSVSLSQNPCPVVEPAATTTPPSTASDNSLQTSLPHFKLTLKNTAIFATCSDYRDSAFGIYALPYESVSSSSVGWVTLLELDISNSHIEANWYLPPSSSQFYAYTVYLRAWTVYLSDIGLSSVQLVNTRFRVFSNAESSGGAGGVFISSVNQHFSSRRDELETSYAKFYKHEVDIVVAGCVFEVHSNFSGEKALVVEDVIFFSRIWVLNSTFNMKNQVATSVLFDNFTQAIIIHDIGYESNKSLEELGWNNNNKNNNEYDKPDSFDLCGIMMYNLEINSTEAAKSRASYVGISGILFARNITISHISTSALGGLVIQTVTLGGRVWGLDHFFVQHIHSICDNVTSSSQIFFNDRIFYANSITLDNITLLRRGSLGQTTGVTKMTAEYKNTMITLSNFKATRDDDEYKDASDAVFVLVVGLVGVRSVYITNVYATGYSNGSPISPITIIAREKNPKFTGEIVIENVTLEVFSTPAVSGISIVRGFAPTEPGRAGVLQQTGVALEGENALISEITVRNASIDLMKNFRTGSGLLAEQCAFALGSVILDTFVVSGSNIARGTKAFCTLPLEEASIGTFISAPTCSFFGDFGQVTDASEATLLLSQRSLIGMPSGFNPKPANYILERCTETKSFKFPDPTNSLSLSDDTPSISTSLSPSAPSKSNSEQTSSPTHFKNEPDNIYELDGTVKDLFVASSVLFLSGAQPVAVTSVQQILMMSSIRKCGNSPGSLEALSFDSNPLGMKGGSVEQLETFVGAALGNVVVLVISLVICACSITGLKYYNNNNNNNHNTNSSKEERENHQISTSLSGNNSGNKQHDPSSSSSKQKKELELVFRRLRFPSILFVPIIGLAGQTTSAAFTVYTYNTDIIRKLGTPRSDFDVILTLPGLLLFAFAPVGLCMLICVLVKRKKIKLKEVPPLKGSQQEQDLKDAEKLRWKTKQEGQERKRKRKRNERRRRNNQDLLYSSSSHQQVETTPRYSFFIFRLWQYYTHPVKEWDPDSSFVMKYLVNLEATAPLYFGCIDLACLILISAAAGVSLNCDEKVCCTVASAVVPVVCLVQLVCVFYLRPFLNISDSRIFSSLSFVNLLISIFVVLEIQLGEDANILSTLKIVTNILLQISIGLSFTSLGSLLIPYLVIPAVEFWLAHHNLPSSSMFENSNKKRNKKNDHSLEELMMNTMNNNNNNSDNNSHKNNSSSHHSHHFINQRDLTSLSEMLLSPVEKNGTSRKNKYDHITGVDDGTKARDRRNQRSHHNREMNRNQSSRRNCSRERPSSPSPPERPHSAKDILSKNHRRYQLL